MSVSASDPWGEKPWVAKPGCMVKCVVTLLGHINTELHRELTLRGRALHTASSLNNDNYMYVFTGDMSQENRAAFDVQLRRQFGTTIKAGHIEITENSGGHIDTMLGQCAKGDISVFFAAQTVPKAA